MQDEAMIYKGYHMNKDAILASVIGFGIGLLITGGILVGPTVISQLATRLQEREGTVASATNEQASTTPGVNQPLNGVSLSIESPKTDAIVNEDNIEVKGKTLANTMVIVAGDTDEDVIQTDASGAFVGNITLKEGINDITVTAIQGTLTSLQKIVVFYTP